MPHKADTTVICKCVFFFTISNIYNMPHKADTTVICKCGLVTSKCYMPIHLRTAKHARDIIRLYFSVCVCLYIYIYIYIYGSSGVMKFMNFEGNSSPPAMRGSENMFSENIVRMDAEWYQVCVSVCVYICVCVYIYTYMCHNAYIHTYVLLTKQT